MDPGPQSHFRRIILAYRRIATERRGSPRAWTRMTREQQFLSELAVIEQVIAGRGCRGLRVLMVDDFASVVKMAAC